MTTQITELEPINIKDLVLNEPQVKETLPFDPKTDISNKDWQDFFEYFEFGYKDFDSAPNVWKMSLGMAAGVTLLDPSRASSIQFNDKHWERIYLELKKLEVTTDPGYILIEFPKVLADLKIYSPSRADQYPLDPSYIDWLKSELSQRKKSSSVFSWAAPTTIACQFLLAIISLMRILSRKLNLQISKKINSIKLG